MGAGRLSDLFFRGSLEEKKALLSSITHSDYSALVSLFIANAALKYASSTWFNDKKPSSTLLAVDGAGYAVSGIEDMSNLYTPFLQKKVVTSDAKVVVLGDIHGDITALLSALDHLIESGFLKNDYTIAHPQGSIVFLGDYSNRGPASIPVVAVLIELYLKNPDNVVLLRGNHEIAHSNKNFFNRQQLMQSGTQTLLGEMGQRFGAYTFPDLLAWYDYLPMALYLGWPDELGMTNFVKLCHGGLEIGHTPQAFLADKTSVFCLLEKIDRNGFLGAYIAHVPGLKEQTAQIFAYPWQEQVSRDYIATHINQQPLDLATYERHASLRLGMLWNHFVTENNPQVEFALSPLRRTLYLGKRLVQAFFERASSTVSLLRGVIRGHQHLDESLPEQGLYSTMMTDICAGKGMVKQWDGMVYTLGASDNITGYHSFITLKLDCKRPTVQHFYKKPYDTQFSLRMIDLF